MMTSVAPPPRRAMALVWQYKGKKGDKQGDKELAQLDASVASQ